MPYDRSPGPQGAAIHLVSAMNANPLPMQCIPPARSARTHGEAGFHPPTLPEMTTPICPRRCPQLRQSLSHVGLSDNQCSRSRLGVSPRNPSEDGGRPRRGPAPSHVEVQGDSFWSRQIEFASPSGTPVLATHSEVNDSPQSMRAAAPYRGLDEAAAPSQKVARGCLFKHEPNGPELWNPTACWFLHERTESDPQVRIWQMPRGPFFTHRIPDPAMCASMFAALTDQVPSWCAHPLTPAAPLRASIRARATSISILRFSTSKRGNSLVIRCGST